MKQTICLEHVSDTAADTTPILSPIVQDRVMQIHQTDSDALGTWLK
jgi:hypothetical protein